MCESLDENLNKFPGLLLFVLKCHFILFFFASDAAQADCIEEKNKSGTNSNSRKWKM